MINVTLLAYLMVIIISYSYLARVYLKSEVS